MPTFMQKIRLALKGWSRRREERQREFVARNASWGDAAVKPAPPARSGAVAAAPPGVEIDMEGLAVAFLDDSGRIAYYLDITCGEVCDVRDGAALAEPRYRRIPTRSDASETADRRAFIVALDDARQRAALVPHAGSREEFRRAVAGDRALERAWYSFKNDRAIAAVETWLRESGLG
jgi:hypothetical protein